MARNKLRVSSGREIKQSLGRYLAIVGIVFLGVGFFAGLKVTGPAMLRTMEDYFAVNEFFDYRLISTLGFNDTSIEYLKEQNDAEYVEAAVSFDAYALMPAGNTTILKIHSITEDVNKLVLQIGNMPQAPNEMVVDSYVFSDGLIGKTIKLTKENEDGLDNFAYDEYKVVGVVRSPLYVQYERGTTTLGNGSITGFAYIPYDGFDVDYYTEAYVKLEEDYRLYTDDYKKYKEENDGIWEANLEAAANLRYEEIVSEATDKLNDAKQEFEDKKAEGEEELADAWGKLEDARIEIEDGEKELADGEIELSDAQKKLDDAKREIEDGKIEIADGWKELADAWATLEDARIQLEDGAQEISNAEAVINSTAAQLESARIELEGKEQQLVAAEAALAAQREQLLLLYPEAAVDAMLATYTSQLADGRTALEAGKAQYNAGKSQFDAGLRTFLSEKAKYEEGKAEYENGLAEYNDGVEKLTKAEADLKKGERDYNKGLTEYQDALEDYKNGKKELEDGKKEYEDGLKEYYDAKLEFDEKIADAEAEIADAEAEIADIKKPETFCLGRDTNTGYVCFESDSGIVDGIANVFPVFFFMVAALVCMTTMNRMIEEQRTQIGVLKALGFSEFRIMSKYLFYSGSAGLIGVVSGFAIGTYAFPKAIWFAYGMMYQTRELMYVFSLPLAIISLVATLLCTMGTTYLSCAEELKSQAAELMRPKAPKAGKRIFLEYLPFIWNRLKFLRKVSLRNIFRYKKRLIMMILGISGCTSLLVTAYGLQDSIVHVADSQFENISKYNLAVTLKNPDTGAVDCVEELGFTAEDYCLHQETTVDLVTDNGVKSLYAVVIPDDSNFTDFYDLHTVKRREPVDLPGEGEIVLNKRMADQFKLSIGDRVTVRDDEYREASFTISGINENFVQNYLYMSENTYRNAFGVEPEYKTVFLRIGDRDPHETAAALMDDDQVINVMVAADLLDKVSNMMKSMNLVVLIVLLSAAGLAFIVLYNLTNINITERIREIATIKVLGFYKNETASYVFRENVLLAIMGAAVGLVVGYFFHQFVMQNIVVDMITFDIHVEIISFIKSFFMTILFTILVNLVLSKKLDGISMTESLKSIE